MTAGTVASAYYKLLIVDDEPHILHALVKSLTLRGYQVTGVGSGEEALELLRTSQYALMVLDMNMPGMDGVTTMRLAKSLQPNLLIIILTGYASVETAIAAVKNHAVDYLRKPVPTQLLSDAIKQVLAENEDRLRKEKLADAIADYMGAPGNASTNTGTNSMLYLPPVTLDLINRCIVLDNSEEKINLSTGETKVMECLMRHPNQSLTNKYIAQQIMKSDLDVHEATKVVRPYISRLRGKAPYLNEPPRILDTVHGIGYVFKPRA